MIYDDESFSREIVEKYEHFPFVLNKHHKFPFHNSSETCSSIRRLSIQLPRSDFLNWKPFRWLEDVTFLVFVPSITPRISSRR